MKTLATRALTAGALVMGSLAVAPPALAACDTVLASLGPRTVGVAGEDVATTPGVSVRQCGTVSVPGGVPTPRVETYGAAGDVGIFLDFPSGDVGAEDLVVAVVVDGNYTEVPIPAGTSTDGGTICVFFNGRYYYNPGGCLVYFER